MLEIGMKDSLIKTFSLRQLIFAFGEEWDHEMKEHERKVVINHIWEETLGNNLK